MKYGVRLIWVNSVSFWILVEASNVDGQVHYFLGYKEPYGVTWERRSWNWDVTFITAQVLAVNQMSEVYFTGFNVQIEN